MEDIPDLVAQKILGLLPLKDRKSCRLVCQRWKNEIEGCELIGLNIKLDSRESCSIPDFLTNIVIREVKIHLLTNTIDGGWQNLRLDSTKTLELVGYMDSFFISSCLFRSGGLSQLTKLEFSETFLMGQELTQDGCFQPIQCCFPSLRELHFIVDNDTLDHVDYHIKENGFSIPMYPNTIAHWFYHRIHVLKLLSERVHRNAAYLLGVIQSPRLKVLKILLETWCSWHLEPLHKFIENNGLYLSQMMISPKKYPGSQQNQSVERRILGTRIPVNLRSVYLHMIDPTDKFWKDLLMVQKRLQEVYLKFTTFPKKTFNTFFSSIVAQNYGSLKCLIFKGNRSDRRVEGLEIDMKIISTLRQLETLVISTKGRNKIQYPTVSWTWRNYRHCGGRRNYYQKYPTNLRIKNINDLPLNLRVFKTSFLPSEDFDGVRFLEKMVNLEELQLSCISRTGFKKQPHHVSKFFQTALRHRKLDKLDIEFAFPEPNPPDIGGSWQNIRPVSFDNHSGRTFRLSESECLDKVLRGTWLLEKFYLGDGTWDYCRVSRRQYFKGVNPGALPENPDIPFLKNSKNGSYLATSVKDFEEAESVDKKRCKTGGTPICDDPSTSTQGVSESGGECRFDYPNNPFNLSSCGEDKQAYMDVQFLVDPTTWPKTEKMHYDWWKDSEHFNQLEIEPDSEPEVDDENNETPILPLQQGSDLPKFFYF